MVDILKPEQTLKSLFSGLIEEFGSNFNYELNISKYDHVDIGEDSLYASVIKKE